MNKKKIGKYIILGTFMIITGIVGVSAANTLSSNGVLYGNAVSNVTTVEGALNELYANYNSLLAKGNASASDILVGKKALVKGKEVTGTMADRTSNTGTSGLAWATSNIEITPYNQLRIGITPGYYGSANYSNFGTSGIVIDDFQNKLGITSSKILSGQSIAGVSGTATSDATASASNILSGKTAYVNGSKITGTMADKSGTTVTAGSVTKDSSYTYLSIPSAGYYNTGSKIRTSNSNLGSSKKYIIKDGVIQSGYSMTPSNKSGISWVYDSTIQALSCESTYTSTSNGTVVLGSFYVDLTNISKLYLIAEGYHYNHKPGFIIGTDSSTSSKALEVESFLDVSSYTGYYYIKILTVYGTATKYSKSNYIKHIATTGNSSNSSNPWFIVRDLYYE